MIIGKIAQAALSFAPSKITQSLPFQFFSDPLGTTVGGLVKTFFTKSAARQQYEAALGTPGMLNYLTPSAMVRGAAKQFEKGVTGGVLPGGHVPGGLLRNSRENLLRSQKSGVTDFFGPGGRSVPP